MAGYFKDSDPRGTNIRSAPRVHAPVIGHLPPPARLEPGSDMIVGAEFDIIGAKDGWLLIRDAQTGMDAKQVFKGPGWISGRLVGFTLGANMLRVAPDSDAKACATGGTADITLAWSGEQIVLSGLKVRRPRTDCSGRSMPIHLSCALVRNARRSAATVCAGARYRCGPTA